MWKLYVNGTLVNDIPDGLEKLTSQIKREDNTNVLLYDITLDLTCYGGQDTYSIIYNRWKANKIGETTISLHQRKPDRTYSKVAEGVIMHSSIKFKLIEGSMNFKTEDKGFYGLINSNKGIEVAINCNKTKNGLSITPPVAKPMKIFKCQNGVYKNDNRRGYLVIDVLKHVMNVISDGKITVSAPLFESGGAYYSNPLTYLLAGGHELHYHPVNPLVFFAISWEKLFGSLRKLFCLDASIQGTLDNPILVIDTPQRFSNDDEVYTVPTVPEEINLSIDEKRLFSMVNIGSPKEITDSTHNVADIFPFSTFKRESFHFEGTNNLDIRMNLEYDIITSAGVIDDCIEYSDDIADSYADDVFIIETFIDAGPIWKAIATKTHSDTDGTTDVWRYNQTLTNQQVLSRWANFLPNTVLSPYPDNPGAVVVSTGAPVAYPGNNTYSMYNPAYITSGYGTMPGAVLDTSNAGSTAWPIPLFDDYNNYNYPNGRLVSGTDSSNAYGAGTTQGNPVQYVNQRFTPVTPGNYIITLNGNFAFQFAQGFSGTANSYICRLQMLKYNSGGTLLQTIDIATYSLGVYATRPSYPVNLSGSVTNTFAAGEYAKFQVYVDIYSPVGDLYRFNTLNADLSAVLKTSIAPSSVIVDPKNYKMMLLEFSYPLNLADYEALRSRKEGLVKVPLRDGTYYLGWMNSISFDHNTGLTKFNLLSDGYKVS